MVDLKTFLITLIASCHLMAKNRTREERILFGSHRTVKELCPCVVVLTGLFYDPFVQTSIGN